MKILQSIMLIQTIRNIYVYYIYYIYNKKILNSYLKMINNLFEKRALFKSHKKLSKYKNK